MADSLPVAAFPNQEPVSLSIPPGLGDHPTSFFKSATPFQRRRAESERLRQPKTLADDEITHVRTTSTITPRNYIGMHNLSGETSRRRLLSLGRTLPSPKPSISFSASTVPSTPSPGTPPSGLDNLAAPDLALHPTQSLSDTLTHHSDYISWNTMPRTATQGPYGVAPLHDARPVHSRRLSLDLAFFSGRKVPESPRASTSTAGDIVFMHPNTSNSSLSHTLETHSTNHTKDKHAAATLRPAAAASTPSVLPRPKPREVTNVFPSFMTPMVFASVNPHLALPPQRTMLPSQNAKNKDKARQRPGTATGSEHSSPPASVVTLPKLSLRRIATRRGLFRRNSANEHDRPLPTNRTSSSSDVAEDPSAIELRTMKSHVALASHKFDTARPTAPAPSAAAMYDTSSSASDGHTVVEEPRRVEIAVATLKMRRDVRQESDVAEVLPILRKLRGPRKSTRTMF
ncbi:hypothetical protein WOLCODRAFT_145321 [Wolfiporia cocos MD-104 SS10]|uniref:Uncharacterized protein n=1 Tax=Wolfiporia cocos (strain MD-104) TaxID=742152 RepID=A0A2H3JU39_WOLCO|nr:hypothetical protein WOLCODRAFT_145321 [Wolfiporia cocos MD-104 SS10]